MLGQWDALAHCSHVALLLHLALAFRTWVGQGPTNFLKRPKRYSHRCNHRGRGSRAASGASGEGRREEEED